MVASKSVGTAQSGHGVLKLSGMRDFLLEGADTGRVRGVRNVWNMDALVRKCGGRGM